MRVGSSALRAGTEQQGNYCPGEPEPKHSPAVAAGTHSQASLPQTQGQPSEMGVLLRGNSLSLGSKGTLSFPSKPE